VGKYGAMLKQLEAKRKTEPANLFDYEEDFTEIENKRIERQHVESMAAVIVAAMVTNLKEYGGRDNCNLFAEIAMDYVDAIQAENGRRS
jgi:hypothetical protein